MAHDLRLLLCRRLTIVIGMIAALTAWASAAEAAVPTRIADVEALSSSAFDFDQVSVYFGTATRTSAPA
jgi:hypothetical protein